MRTGRAGRTGLKRARATASAAALAASAAIAFLALGAPVASATTPAEECKGEEIGYELLALGIASSLKPENGAEERVHRTVTFSGESFTAEPEPGRHEKLPLSFGIASSEARLSDPDIDKGNGVESAGASAETSKYTFTSTKAAANLGTVYWDASFTVELKKCNGGEKHTFRTAGALGNKAETLQIVSEPPPPPPTPEPPPASSGGSSGGNSTWSPPAAASQLRAGITASRRIRMRGSAFSYLVSCTATCTGTTAVRAWEARRHGRRTRLVRDRALDFRARKVSIVGAKGGHKRFNDRYRRRALRKLRQALRHHGEVELEVTVSVKDSAGKPVTARRVIVLHG